jgi:hypothetical protein
MNRSTLNKATKPAFAKNTKPVAKPMRWGALKGQSSIRK